ncbi:MAG TPA: M56 family metallopeptidase [Candidatus Cybelea sp.]|nr:M56 family metallopeptidase [Candidatus Cybelea sp.]
MMDTALLNSLWQGGLVTAIAAIAAAFLPKHHAASRYTVWLTALAGLVAVPLITAFHAPYAAALFPAVVTQTTVATSVATQRAADAGGPWLTMLWALGVLFCSARLLLSYARIAAVVRDSRPALDLGQDVRISDSLTVPIAAGFVHPVVILPAAAVRDLPRADLRAIIEHERAHIRRGDLITNLVQRFVEAALFFNPWAYVIGRQLVNEREAACDDWAVAATGAADRYAAYLAELALAARGTPTPLLTPSALGSKRLLLGRIARLLTGKVIVVKANYVAAAASLAAVALLTLALQSKGVASVQTMLAADPNLPAKCYHDVTVINAPAPDIPKSASGIKASANALVTVGADGRPVSARIVLSSGSKVIDNATVVAAMKSTYSPEMSNCKPKAGTYLFRVETGGP